jgi:hypothetical protein
VKAILTLLILFTSTTTWAQEEISPDPIVTIPTGDDHISTLKKGQPAPFDGQLFDTDTAIRWGFWLQQYKYRLGADAKKYQQLCRVEMDFRDKKLAIEQERSEKVEKDLRDRLLRSEKARVAAEEEANDPPWYNTRVFGVIIGVVATAAVFGVAVAAVSATRPATQLVGVQ